MTKCDFDDSSLMSRDEIQGFIVKLLSRKKKIPPECIVEEYRFIDTGHIDSLALIKFILEIEEHYDIEIDDTDIQSEEFRTVSGLVNIVASKLESN